MQEQNKSPSQQRKHKRAENLLWRKQRRPNGKRHDKPYSYGFAKGQCGKRKQYEIKTTIKATDYCVLRFDGVEMTKSFKVPREKRQMHYNKNFVQLMKNTALELFEFLPSSVFLYQFSDEISLLIDTKQIENNYDNRIEKLLSILSSKASVIFNRLHGEQKDFCFDGRVILLPQDKIADYFECRQSFAIIKFLEELRSRNLVGEQRNLRKYGEIVEALKNCRPSIDYFAFPEDVRNGVVVYKNPLIQKGMVANAPEFLADRQYIKDKINLLQ
ncbi:MAG: tRNA(His) guanylyltransferase Thg1 family protein [Firmicutes bacterium]|nr:tRNA(His) guanylyltransferase Thg1 family protein [Bacillota bacterium]